MAKQTIDMDKLLYIGFWCARGPKSQVVLVLCKDPKLGYLINICNIPPRQADNSDSRSLHVPHATEAQAITTADAAFKALQLGGTAAGPGWSPATRTIVRGTRAAMVEALRAQHLDELEILN